MKVLDFARFCGFYLRELKLPESNLVNNTHNVAVTGGT